VQLLHDRDAEFAPESLAGVEPAPQDVGPTVGWELDPAVDDEAGRRMTGVVDVDHPVQTSAHHRTVGGGGSARWEAVEKPRSHPSCLDELVLL
jgi:hypothetical protein